MLFRTGERPPLPPPPPTAAIANATPPIANFEKCGGCAM